MEHLDSQERRLGCLYLQFCVWCICDSHECLCAGLAFVLMSVASVTFIDATHKLFENPFLPSLLLLLHSLQAAFSPCVVWALEGGWGLAGGGVAEIGRW